MQLYKEQTVHGLRPWGTRGSRGAPLGPQPYFFVGRTDRTSAGDGSRYDSFLARVQRGGLGIAIGLSSLFFCFILSFTVYVRLYCKID